MKVRFYPKKAHVQSILTQAIQQENDLIRDCDTKLAALNQGGLFLPGETSWAQQKSVAMNRKANIQTQLDLLNSHDPPEVMAEVEL